MGFTFEPFIDFGMDFGTSTRDTALDSGGFTADGFVFDVFGTATFGLGTAGFFA